MSTRTLPQITKVKTYGEAYAWRVNAPNGELVGIFYNEQFLRTVMEKVFDWSPFEPLPIKELQK